MSGFWPRNWKKKSRQESPPIRSPIVTPIPPPITTSIPPPITTPLPPPITTPIPPPVASSSRQTPKILPSLANKPGTSKLQAKCHRFRILIIGRANSGKTTILKRTCNTTGDPVVYDHQGVPMDPTILKSSAGRGIHDIENEMVFESNPGFCFHDSRGFEAGGIDELERVKTFIDARSKERKLAMQIHAIWYCIPVDDSRPFTTAEHRFFSECGTGQVPVIAIFTKFDALDDRAFGALVSKGITIEEAVQIAPEQAVRDFEHSHSKSLYAKPYPPKDHVYLRDMNQEGANCTQLVEKTAEALDNEVLQQLFVSTQRNSLELCMRYMIDHANRRMMKLEQSPGPEKFKEETQNALRWFPQYRMLYHLEGLLYGHLGLDEEYYLDLDELEEHDEALSIYAQFVPLLEALEPVQKLLYFRIVTPILAEFEYFLQDAGHSKARTLSLALSVYQERGADPATLAESIEEALKALDTNGSKEEFDQAILQIALKNRLPQDLLQDPIVTENRGANK